MSLESSVAHEKHNYNELSCAEINVTCSVQIFCKYLFDNTLNHGQYIYPSLNAFKFDEKLSISSRTIDRLVKFLIQVNILTKLPRSKTQAYQVNVNNPLFWFILNIYQPTLPISISTKQVTISTKRFEELQSSKEHLKDILIRLKSKKDYIVELHESLLDEITENDDTLNTSEDDLKESFRTNIIDFSTRTVIGNFSILNDFIQG